ncbi:MAG: ABC transporter ATP-binding protein [Vicinamibacterales bacterium]
MTAERTGRIGLAVEDARIAFGGSIGLDAVSLQVSAGGTLALLGPSGVGKTSLLRAVAGLGGLHGGRVIVDGRDVTMLPPERRGIVYMHQAPSLFPHLSVIDNVAFPLEVRGVPRQAARARAGDLLAQVRLEPLAGRAPSTLSGGQRHRVALARALAAGPGVLLLDEPFSSLDPELRAEARAAVLDLLAGGDGPALVMVTHDVDEAAGLSERLAILIDGGVAQCAAPSEVLTRPRTLAVARFLGLANLVAGSRDDAGRVECALGRFASPGPPGPVVVTVRPAAVRAGQAGTPGVSGRVVDVLERVGGTTLRVLVGDVRCEAVPDGSTPYAPGAAVSLATDPAAVHVIDGHV